ncbi:collagen-binding trimeric autotransporter adhesin [Burkholderia territorii]|nr:YadA-like family protein [Burkholderia territorii]VWB81656.1 collagen-binding trimeric autotransporter adhesin [Burkholderia territorii]
MNKAHRTLFNTATGTWVAVSELATARKKSGGRRALVRSAIALAAVALSLGASQAFAATAGADACTTADGQNGVVGEAGVCTVPSAGAIGSVGTMGAIGTSAVVDDAYIKVLPATMGGTAATASGTAAVAIGNAAVANGTSVLAFGSAATATGTGSMAFGRLAKATGGTSATAIGNDSIASGTSVLAIGSSATATGSGVVAIGRLATATSDNSTALGNQTSVLATGGVALGTLAGVSAGATNSVAIGNHATVDANVTNAMALGTNSNATRNDTISVGSSTLQRQITNMAAGTQDTDAVNVSQLAPVVTALGGGAAIDPVTGVVTGPTYGLANGGTQHTVADALGALDGELTIAKGDIAKNASDITNINSKLNAAVTDDYVKINTVADPALAAADSIAIGGAATAVGTYSVVVGHRAAATGNNATALGVDAQASGESSLAVGKGATAAGHFASAIGVGATASGDQSVALGIRSVADRDATVSVGSATLQRQIIHMAAGTDDTDAVNVGQLKGVAGAIGAGTAVNADGSIAAPSFMVGDGNGGTKTFDNVGDVVTNLDGRVTTNESDIAKLADQIGSGTTGLVQQAGAGAGITVGANTDGATVNFAGTAGERKLTGVANGAIAAGSTDAVTGDQLFATNRDVAKNASDIAGLGSDVSNLGTQVTNIDGRVTQNETHIAKNTSDIAGLGSDVSNLGTQVTSIDGRVTQNETHIAKNTSDITWINDQLAELSGGTIGLVQQAAAGADLTVGANTDGAAVNFAGTAGERKLTGIANGDVAAGSRDAVTGDQLHAVAVDVTHLDQRVTNNETSITQIRSEMNNGSIGLVKQAAAGADLTVGENTDGAAVNFAGTAGERKLTGIANGDVAAGSRDAVTGDQLHATNRSVAQNASDIADNRTEITNINDRLATGQLGLVRQDQATGAISVAANTGGASVSFAGTNGARTLSGVANAANDDEAVTLAQLKASGLVDKDGKELGAVVYDDLSLASATLGGVNGTVLRNVAPGLIASGSMDAVNGGQLYDMRQDFENRFAGLGDRVSDLEAGGVPGGPGNGSGDFDPSGSGAGSVQLGAGADAAGSNSTAIGNSASATAGGSTAIGQGSVASGENSTSLGQGSNASGSGSTAIGQNANAAGNNSVALGAGSTADRDNAVSVGSAGAERQITNVAAGTAPTDAVNVQQMNNAAHSARQDAMGGVAAAMAVAGLPQSTQPGRTFVAIAGSTYGGEYGSALGVSYMTRDGKWTIKASANTSSRGAVGAVVGGGFYW